MFATFGDSLPIENLAEAANETAKTGELVGSLADALNWAGIHEDTFKEKQRTTSEQERQRMITETLMGLYSGAAEKYRTVNDELIRTNEIQSSVNDSMAKLGETMRPIVNDTMQIFAEALKDLVDWLSGLDEGTLKTITAITGIIAVVTPLLLLIGGVAGSIDNITGLMAKFAGEATVTTVATEAVGKAAGGTAGAVGLLSKAVTFLLNPVTLTIAAIALLVVGIMGLWNTSDEFREFWIDMWGKVKAAPAKAISDIKSDLSQWAGIGEAIIDKMFGGIKSGWQDIENWINSKFGWLDDKLNDWGLGGGTTKALDAAGGAKVNGSHYNGLSYVPFDGYIAQLHQGERVLTASENSTYNNKNQYGGINITIDAKNIKEVNDLINIAENARRMQRMGVAIA